MSRTIAEASSTLHALGAYARAAVVRLPDGLPGEASAAERLSTGVPALQGEPLLKWVDLCDAIAGMAAALEGTDAAAGVTGVHRRLKESELDRQRLAQAALDGGWQAIADTADVLRLDPELLVTTLDWAARPALRAAATALASVVADAQWRAGHCPVCGAPPVLSVVRGKERERWLHCGRCGTSWAYERVRCPMCGQRDHSRMGYLHAQGEGEHRRAEVCDACRTYVKSVMLLDAPDPDRLLELDLDTAALDFLALDAGYQRSPVVP
ncbi:MAG TPA: formate dehydrogenase accessory protein FdhE [Gemmatimonadales bacterium]|nr:formate dehydrogenase accessory protein FdhE [Gemmatimonadales bacterium]